MSPLRIAIAKGRLFEQIRSTLAQSSWVDPVRASAVSERALRVPVSPRLELLMVRAQDVPVYVQRGAAHAGICGLDTILEAGGNLVELCDLGLGQCRLCLCGPEGKSTGEIRTVATKFPALTRLVLARSGRSCELVKLSGALELAPLVGLADGIVDLVETGRTLRDNGLEEWETLLPISARLFTTEANLVARAESIAEFTRDLKRLVRV